MRIVQINATSVRGSTGKICLGIAELSLKNGIDNVVLYNGADEGNRLGTRFSKNRFEKFTAVKSRVLGNFGFNSIHETKLLIKKIDEISPGIVHIHNIHSQNCNYELLMSYLKSRHIKTVWTFHDCWAFTGYCTHFVIHNCDRWKSGCHNCPQKKTYSWFFDRSGEMLERKKLSVEGLDLSIVTPSVWLSSLVKKSIFKNFDVKVINNGIDLNVFRPTASDFRRKYSISGSKFILLGVAFDWGYSKGADVFVDLAKRLPADKYQIVLVGTDKSVDRQLPHEIISIHRTQNQTELAEIYSASDLFVNPTREDSFPTVNMEALACGIPILTFRTGGSPEILDETCGSVVECGDIDAMEKEIIRICDIKPYTKESCIKRAGRFDKYEKYADYIKLYKELL